MRPFVSLRGIALPLLALSALLTIVPVAARTAQDKPGAALPPAREIIDRHIKEVGGRQAIMALTSTHAVGVVTLPAAGLSGKLEAFHAKPNKFVQRIALPGIGDLEEGFDGTIGWSLSPLTGPALLEGKQLTQRRFDADFHEELKAADRYASMTTLEKTTFEQRPAYKVRLVQKSGEEDIEFYDAETGLKIGALSTRESPMGPMQGTTVFSDYKKFGALLQPTATKITMMGTQMLMTVSSVSYGTVDPNVFVPPAQVKALIK